MAPLTAQSPFWLISVKVCALFNSAPIQKIRYHDAHIVHNFCQKGDSLT